MSKQYFNEYKKKKEEEEKKTGSKTPSQSSSSQKAASKSTFLGGGSAVTNVKKASEKKGPSEAKKKQAASNALKTSQKSTFMGGTQTTPTRRTTTKTTTNRDLTANTTAAQRQKMGMPTSEDLRNARESRRNLATNIKNSVKEASSADNKAFMQRQKSGTLTTADKQRIEQTSQRRAEVARNTGAAARKGAEDSITGYRKTLADLAEMTQSTDRASYGQAAKLGIDKDEDIVEWAKLEGRRKKGYKQAKEQRLALQEKQDERQAEWDERTKNATGFEKALYGAAESGTGMLVDIGVGAATGTGQFGALASMGLRTYGTTRGQAEKEGATEKEDRLYSLMQAGKEVGTELMFTGAGLAKKAYGKVGLSLADRAANVLTKGLTGTKADIVGAGVRLLGGTAEENIEELAGWGADPLIKELTYGKNVRQRTAESLRANIPQITNKAEADKVAAYFNTSEFTDELTKEYKKSGMSDDEANALAEEMRDYYLAYYSGDQKKLEELEDDLSRKLSGQPGLSKKSWSFDELGETFAATTLLTLATGLPGAVKTSVKGNQAFNDPNSPLKLKFGDNAAKLVANAVKNVSDKELSVKAEAMEQRLESGKDLTGTQKWDLLQGYQQKLNETAKKARASQDVVNTARREQNLVATMRTDRNGNVEYAKETQREFNQAYADAELTVEAVRRYLESENSISDDEVRRADAVKKAVADLHVGGMTVGDAHEFAYGNNLARETLRAEEGIDLDQYIVRDSKGSVDYAATNEATENALYALNAENAIRAAQEETRVYIDDTRGRIDSDIMGRMGVNGQATWKTINKTVDPRNINEYLTTARAASYFYSAGRNTDMDMENAINQYSGGAFRSVDKTVLREAFAAGSRDRMIANTPGYGQTVSAGSNIAMKNTAPIITGQFIMDENIKESVPDTVQQAYIALAMSTNTNVHLVSDLTAKGKDGKPIINQATGLPVQLNGMSKGNDIYINVNSTAEQNLGYVFMHEMTHQIKQYAPNEYMGLENLVRERWFNKNNAQMQQAIQSRIDLYKTKGGQSLTEEEAMEEIIADAMAEAMDDPNFAAQVCEEDINLGQAILNSIKAALRSIRQIFASGDFQNENFHNGLLSYLGILDEAEKMWINALHQARINKANGLIADWQDNANKQNEARLSVNEEIDEKPISEKQREALNAEGIEELDDGTTARYSLTSWKETNKDKKLKALVAAGHSRDASESWIDDINSIASIIHGDPERLDYIADRANKFLKPNGDYYKYTLDASTLCDKRRIYQGTYDAIQHAMPNIPLMQDDVVRIRTLLKEMDHKAPCGICYVESQRKNLGDYAKQWYDSYARKDEIQLADVTTTNGLKALKESNPEVAADFEKAMAAKGVSSPKVVKLRTDYREDIMRMRPQTVEYLNSIGGLRFHSFSDFETPHLIDTMQAVMDMATKNLKGMAYAKVPNFAAVFGPTGIKINLSLIAKTDENGNAVHDEDGRLVFDSVEGIPYEEAKVWRDAYPDDVAFILVGKDKKHTLEAINDDRVDFVIPFHRSKWSAEDMRRLGLVGYEDFATGHQENGIFVSEFWNYDISGRENAENYLKLCAEKGVTPVFEQLLKQNEDGTYSLQDDGSTDNYWKLLVEGKMYNHKTKKGAPQKLVKPNFNMEEARRILNEYEGGANELPVADDVVKAFVKEYKQNHPDAEIADAKYSIAATLDDAYMNAVNSGNMEEAQRLVDEAAKAAMPDTKLKGHWYHGTENDFTVFNFSQGGKNGTADGFGIYLTNDPEVASSYGNRMIEGYVNATRPASALTSQTLTKAELRRLITRTVEDEAIQMAEDYDSNVEEAKFDTWISNYTDTRYAGTINKAIDQVISGITSYNGNDMDIIQEIMVGMGIRNYDEATKFYDILTETTGIDGFVTKWGDESEMADPNTPTIALAFRSSQIKSADTVTYAEDGSVIPLSERFDLSNNDIRYSLPTTDSDGRALSDGQMEYFKNSQARDSQGRLQTVYHTTNYGGFTIFDPSYSDDRRSLFFASNFDVSQTYGSGAINPVDLNNEPFKTWDDFVKAANEEFKNYPEWDPNKSFYENTEFSFTNGIRKADIPFEEWIKLSHKEQRDSDYGVEMALPVKGNPDFDWTWYEFYDFDTMLKELNWAMGRGKKQRGFYQVYLNLENPLVVDAKGANWNKIPYGEKGENAERIRTLQRMKEDSAFVIDRVSMEWVYDDDGDIISMDEPSSLHLRIEGSKVTVDSDLVPYTVDEMFYMSSEDIDNWDPNDNSTMVILYEKLDEYWTYDIGLSGEYLEWIAEYADKNGDVNYIPMNVNQEHAADYIDLDGYKLEYAEYFDDENPEGTLPYTNAKDPTFKTRELAKIAQDAGHDGVIIRNCRDMGGVSYFKGSNPISDIFIAFDSNQIKDLENENPTVNPDIRYSITDEDAAMEWLATQYELDDVPLEDQQAEEGRIRMAKSKKEFVNSINTKWNERWLTEGKVLDVKSVRKNIKDLVTGIMFNADTDHKYNGKVVDDTLIDAKSAYWLMKEGKHGEAAELLWDSAIRMIENVDFIEDTTFKQYKDLRDYMRTTSFKLGEEYWSDVDYQAFRKRNFGRIKLVKGDTNIDELYQELQERWPEWFNEEEQMTAPDQLLHIEEVLDAIQPYKIAYTSEEAEQLAGDVADTLYDIVYQGKEYKSIADTYKEKYDAKTKALKARHQEALAKVRAEGDLKVRKERAKFKEYKEQKKNAKEKAKHIGRIADNIDWLTTRLINETKDKNIPEGFRKSLAHMLMQFDMQTERSKKLEEKYGPAKKTLQMRELKDKLAQIAKEDDTGEFRYDGYLFYLMDALAEKVDGQVIDSLDTEDLIAIDTMLKSIVHNFRNYNKIRVEEEKVAIANIGDNIINAMDERIRKYGKRKSYDKSARGYLDRLVNEGEETPIYLFERLDPKGNGIGAMYKELRRGEDRHIRNMNFLRNRFKAMFSEYSNKNKSGSKLEEWRDTSQAQTFNLENGSITLNPAQIMSLYCLSKRPQAMGHILGSGIVATPISFGAKLNERFKGSEEQVDSVMVTYSELQEIIATLTEDQARLADEMQALMNNEMAAWGNEVSLELHGIKLFRETDYFPIKASNEVLQKTAENRDVQEKIKNFGFTKPLTRNANNAIMIDDIFSVVADHCNKMSLYNSMAIPITDFMRVYNYTQKNEGEKPRTVQAAIGEAFTRKVNDYIMKFIADVNGNTKTRSDAVDDLMNKALANYKRASIGFNARVALQQPTAIFRSLMVIDAKYFKGTRLISPEDQREMFEHCPIALWKSWGHYDMDMGRDIEDIMMNNDWSAFDTVTMGAYGWLDNIAWGKIWQAVKNEVKDKHPDVKVGSNAFFRLCNERASEVFDKTQVVDSIFHRSETMRSKNTLTKMATSFMAEPTLTYNVFRDSIVKANELRKEGKKEEANKLLFKMMLVLTLNAAAVSGAAAIWDAVRGKGDDDDEDDEKLLERGLMKLVTMFGGSDPWAKEDKSGKDLWLINFLNNFVDNAPWAQWNNVYFVKDIISLKDGWGTSNMALEGWETLFKGFSQAHKKITKGSKTSWYDIDMNIAGGIGYLFGWPVKTFMRDAKALLEKAGIEVFAADDTETEAGLMDSLANKLKFTVKEEPTEKKSRKEKKAESAEYDAKVEEYRESLSDNYSEEQKDKLVKQYKKQLDAETEPELPEDFNVKEHVQQGITDFEFEMEKRSLKAAENAAGKTGNAKNSALWDVISEGYTKSVESGNMGTIQAMRDAFVANGGDAEWFDAKITDRMKSAYKKTISTEVTPGASARQENMKNYLTSHGVTDQELSEIVRSTATARDLKAALRMGVEEYILDELTALIQAGLTYDDLEYLYKYRNYGAKDYDGKYTDSKYMISTGRFNWPATGTITSHFGYRNAPTRGASSNHPAIDIAMPVGTPVAAADGGVVIYAGANSGYGNSVGIRHDNGMVTYYNHLDSWCVNVGDRVGQGMQIANSGNTGISTGPHLDFKILDKNGKPVDPEKYLSNG